MTKLICRLAFVIAFALIAGSSIQAQDTASANFKYVVLHYDHNNNAAPDFQKFRENLEAGIKELLEKNKIPVLRYQKEANEKKLQDCDTLTCTYSVKYKQGMMLNAEIKSALIFTDCHKKEIYTASGKKMVGAVAGADAYLKVFAKLIKPDMLGKIKH